MAGDLIFPRCEVYWGSYNLSAFTLPGATEKSPLVFNVTARIADGNTNPTGSMEWNPAAPAFDRYMQFLKESLDQQIVVRFFYLGGRSIAMKFVWAGNSISYGNEMRVTVDLKSELDGLVNPVGRSVSSNTENEAPVESFGLVTTLRSKYGIENKDILLFDPVAAADLKKAKIAAYNRLNQTYAQAVNTVTESNGNMILATNYGEKVNLTIMSPWSYKGEGDKGGGNESTEVKRPDNTTKVDPVVRYGYLLGPHLINTIERQYRWVPPQQTNTNQLPTGAQPTAPTVAGYPTLPPPGSPPTARPAPAPVATPTPAPAPTTRATPDPVREAAGGLLNSLLLPQFRTAPAPTPTPAPAPAAPAVPRNTSLTNQAISGAATSPAGSTAGPVTVGQKMNEDKVGVKKKKILNDEGACRLSVSTLMFPALVGIKPGDIVYVPSLGSDAKLFIEDWVVHGVTYTQTDGGVNLSIEGSRWFGNPDLMQKKPAEPWIKLARTLNADPTLTKWQQYAWSLTGAASPVAATRTVPTPTTTPPAPSPVPLQVIPFPGS